MRVTDDGDVLATIVIHNGAPPTTYPVLWQGGVALRLPPLQTWDVRYEATAMNSRGQVVGAARNAYSYQDDPYRHPVRWDLPGTGGGLRRSLAGAIRRRPGLGVGRRRDPAAAVAGRGWHVRHGHEPARRGRARRERHAVVSEEHLPVGYPAEPRRFVAAPLTGATHAPHHAVPAALKAPAPLQHRHQPIQQAVPNGDHLEV